LKIRLIRDDIGVAAGYEDDPQTTIGPGGQAMWKRGAIIDVPARACQLLVGNGDAEPADSEAEATAGDWKKNRSEVLLAREMLAKCIDPDDRERYRNGEILGYDADGNDIPGPNWIDTSETEDDEEDE
jgi:hypothetical protein